MTPALITAIAAIAAALGVAAIAGVLHNRRSGVLRDTATPTAVDTSDLGLSRTGPTIVHFSAVWCGPCAGVRRVVDQVCADLPEVAHIEIDMDANPVCGPEPFGAVAADHVHLRRRRQSALPDVRGAEGRRPAVGPRTLCWPETGFIG